MPSLKSTIDYLFPSSISIIFFNSVSARKKGKELPKWRRKCTILVRDVISQSNKLLFLSFHKSFRCSQSDIIWCYLGAVAENVFQLISGITSLGILIESAAHLTSIRIQFNSRISTRLTEEKKPERLKVHCKQQLTPGSCGCSKLDLSHRISHLVSRSCMAN